MIIEPIVFKTALTLSHEVVGFVFNILLLQRITYSMSVTMTEGDVAECEVSTFVLFC